MYVRDNVWSTKYDLVCTTPRRIEHQLNDTTVRLDDGTVRNSKDLLPALPNCFWSRGHAGTDPWVSIGSNAAGGFVSTG